jgi:predicted cation transporter
MMTVVGPVIIVDLLILLLVLVLPLAFRRVEQNLEAFLFVMGTLSALVAGVVSGPLIRAALTHPIPITLAVFASGLLFKSVRQALGVGLTTLAGVIPHRVLVALLILVLGVLSSVLTAIIAALVLVEVLSALRFRADDEVRVAVIACMAIGLGAALTPLGEPLSTIATAKLDADFWFLMRLLGSWVIPGIVLLGVWGAVLPLRPGDHPRTDGPASETYWNVAARALRVYLFVMGLTLLGEGFTPLIDRFVVLLDTRALYWINMVSAILDNATLTAAELHRAMTPLQVRAVLMGLLISGGMLIPGNIPNIVAAHKLRISSRTWARAGVPLGLVSLVGYFVILFVV